MQGMQGIEKAYCNMCIRAVLRAGQMLMDSSAVEALRKARSGKGDTLGLDATTESTIRQLIERFDQNAIFITEELDEQAHRRWPTDSDPERQPLMLFSDPTDRSTPLEKYIIALADGDLTAKVSELMNQCKAKHGYSAIEFWERMNDAPATITGATSSITCIRKGKVVFTVIYNLITGDICLASDSGVHLMWRKDIARHRDLTCDDIVAHGKILHFPSVEQSGFGLDDSRRFVTFLAKPGYSENLNDSGLFVSEEEATTHRHHFNPAGPPRPLYLSELQKGHGSVGFILSNGEKIGEWMPWLAIIKHARNHDGGRALRAFEIVLDRPHTKYGVLMSTPGPYSIFCGEGEVGYLDISRLSNYERPSQFRCMIVVVPYDNERMIQVLEQFSYREVTNWF